MLKQELVKQVIAKLENALQRPLTAQHKAHLQTIPVRILKEYK